MLEIILKVTKEMLIINFAFYLLILRYVEINLERFENMLLNNKKHNKRHLVILLILADTEHHLAIF